MSTPTNELLNVEALASSLPSRFQVVKTLGSGANGVVLLATDQLLGREVAIKILRSEELSNETAQKRFMREARLLATIDHPNIVKILASDITENGYPYHVMEYLDGTPLSERLRGKPLPFDQFCEIMVHVCAGLQCAHNAGVIHRDLKPSNIFVCHEQDGKELVKIIDFGMSKAEDAGEQGNLTRTNAVLGSPTYMSPEQCKGKAVTAASDIYSLGCIMYECVTGAPPFQAETAYEVMYKHINASTQSLTLNSKHAIGQSLGKLIDSCLVKDPAQRPSDLKKISAELAEISKVEIRNQELFLKRKENKTLLLLLVAILAFGVIAGTPLYFYLQQKQKQTDAAIGTVEKDIADEQAHKLQQIRKRIEIQKSRLLRTTGKNEQDERDLYAFKLIDSYKAMYAQLRLQKNMIGTSGLKHYRKHPEDKNYLETKRQALAILDEEYPFTEMSNSKAKMQQQLLRNKANTLIELDKLDEALKCCDEAMRIGGEGSLEASEVLSTRALCHVLRGDYSKALDDVNSVYDLFSTIRSEKQENAQVKKAAKRHGMMLSSDRRGVELSEAGLAIPLSPPPTTTADKVKAAKICCTIIRAWMERSTPDEKTSDELLEIAQANLKDVPANQQEDLPQEIAELKKLL
jgi:serine/threonine-protein kinase